MNHGRTSLRVGLFGNIANSHFQLGRALAAFSDLEVLLFSDLGAERIKRPESDYPELASSPPPWIRQGAYGLSARSLVAPWTDTVVEDLRTCDVVIASGYGPALAQFSGRPWAFLATGGDLTVSPFPWAFRSQFRSVRARAALFGMAPWQRRAIRRADAIWAQPFSPNMKALARLGVDSSRVESEYLPFVLDTDLFCFQANATQSADPLVRRMLDRSDFIVFHPSRLMIDDAPARRVSGQWKANDVLLHAFAKLVSSGAAERPLLVMPDRSESPDVAKAKEIIAAIGLGDHVLWASPPRPDGFTRNELVSLYSVADVIADDFGIGWFGTVVLEGLSIGKPVVSYVDEAVVGTLYPWHPICSARTPEGVGDILVRLARDPVARSSVGLRGRRWVEEFHSYSATAPRYAAAIERLAAKASPRRGSTE